MQAQDKKVLQDITEYLQCLMTRGLEKTDSKIPRLETPGVSKELTELHNVFARFSDMLHSSYDFQKKIADGNLDSQVDPLNFLAMPLQALQSSLRHLTWQASQVAKGDLEQRIYFLGDFSESFNSMIAALKEKELLQAKLQRTEKMEAIGLMASGVAHDLNNILSGITGYPELLLQRLPEESDLRKPLEAIKESGERATAVVADLLTVARGAASTWIVANLNTLIREYLDSPEYQQLHALYPQIQCDKTFTKDLPNISCSPVHIKKCLMNLVTNATEAMDKSGSISLNTTTVTPDLQWARENRLEQMTYVVLTVTDTGPGIRREDIEHIFEPFYTKKVMGRSGTGLGLAVVWNTMEDHKGKVLVESSKKGTCFQLYFPICKEEESVQPEDDRPEEITANSERILVVDDEPQLRDIASQILRALGYKVDSVCSGELAIQFVTKSPVDLIIMDMLMEPGMNGRQTYEKIIKLYPEQKVIIASGFAESSDVQAVLQLGADGFIQKPYSINQLAQAVTETLQN